jgi:hypothetical protein
MLYHYYYATIRKMPSNEIIKQILYSVIEEIGRKNIQLNISSDIKLSQKYTDIIVDRCLAKLTYEPDIYIHDLDLIILGEALLHFMLTISTLPSERKVEINNQVLDIVIPSLPSLMKDPDKSLIIQIIKDKKTDLTKVEKLEYLQPNSQNIWCISTRPLSITKHIEYSIFPNHRSHSYSKIITDIDKFLRIMNDKSLRFIP